MTDRSSLPDPARPAPGFADRRSGSTVDMVPSMIRPPGRWPGWGAREAWRYRSICLVLAQRALKVRYRQTAIGLVWVLIQPLALMVIFTLFFGMMARLSTEGVPFPVFYLSGLVVWQVVSKVTAEGTGSVVGNSALVGRVYFPRVYFPVSVALASVVDLLVDVLALVLLMLVFGMVPTATILVAPVLILIGYATALGLAMLLSALNVRYRDVSILVPLLVQVWFFITPVLYPASIVPSMYQWVYYLNPMALVITGIRWAFLGTPPPPDLAWPLGIVVAGVLLVGGYLIFRQREPMFADVV